LEQRPQSDPQAAPADAARPSPTPGSSFVPNLGRLETEIRRVAPSDVTLLIEGESGSGKNLAARAVHAASARKDRPYVEVQLTALSPTLLESELFGHEAGAFTGAEQARVGRFLRAQGGTFVLDGVEALPPEVQVKLLRVLQERAVEPLGSERSIALDVRLIALSSRDLEGEVRAGRFREDLYYRVAVVRLRVPPLRARVDDLPELCELYLARAAQRLGVAQRSLTAAAFERLRAHAWPGNLRELENVLERVSILAPRASGGAEARGGRRAAPARDIAAPIEAAELDFLAEASEGVAEDLARQALAHGIGLEALERAVIARAHSEQRGNVSAAARRLGLSRRAFETRHERVHGAPRANDAAIDEHGGDA
jgi:DNA-binding NtrC family response regulator